MSISGYVPPVRDIVQEERVRKELKQIDSLLDIYWHPYAYFNQRYEQFEGRHFLTVAWPVGDKRKTSGKENQFDMLGVFCTDIDDASSMPVSPEAMMPLIMQRLANADGERLPHVKRMAVAMKANQERQERLKRDTVDEAVQQALHDRNKIYGITQSTGADFS